MGRIIQQNNGKTTVYVTGENFSSLSPTTNTYFLGVDLTSGYFEKKNPNGSVINLESGTGGSPFTGGTVSGSTIFTDGLSASTLSSSSIACSGGVSAGSLSATTYLNLPADIYITGGTYSAGTLTLSRSVLSNIVVTGFTNNAIVTTYSQLSSDIASSSLMVGAFYLISDYQTCYDQPDFDYNGNSITSVTTYHTAAIEPILVLATSSNTLAPDAYQPAYPNDKIKYDYSFNVTEKTGSPAKGRITERIDEFNNRTDYDHRTIVFKRYRYYTVNTTINGKIIQLNNGAVTGLNTNFTSDLNVGDVVRFTYQDSRLYEVTDIASNTGMTVTGWNYNNFTSSIGVDCLRMQSTPNTQSGTLYYFNDVGNNNISDGGNDMYDTGNEINTNLSSIIPYTHTQMTNPPIDEFNQASYSDFAYDGIVQTGDTYFGSGSNYFTNSYPGLFVMVAHNVDIDNFYISGDLGADGGGSYDDFSDTISGYSVYGKFVFGAQDPSVSHIFIVDSTDNAIGHDYSTDTDDDYDSLTGITAVTQVHYLLFALGGGVKPTNDEINNVVSTYLSLVDGYNINTVLSNLNSSFTAVTSNLPANAIVYPSLYYKQNNITGDTVNYEELPTFNYQSSDVINNYIGDYANLFNWEGNDFILANNVFKNSDYVNNKFGNACSNNSFDDDCTNNFVGDYFYNNTFDDDFDSNIIGDNFNNNEITENFQRNRIGYDFNNNILLGDSFYRNNIGNDFNNNYHFRNDFQNNEIGNQFQYNTILDDFYKNDIGNGYNQNITYSNVYGNLIGNGFNNNTIYLEFYENTISDIFGDNTLGKIDNIGAYNFYKNRIGVDFTSNTCLGDFAFNQIGSNFNNNIIDDGFGFGGSASQGNVIGNYFYDNSIGEYFYNNTISDGFYNNTVGEYFQLNNIKSDLVNNIDFTTYYQNITAYTYTAIGTSATDGTYVGLTGTTTQDGINASFDVTVVSSAVTSVSINVSGIQYDISDTINIKGSQIGGVDSVDDVNITVTGVTPKPNVYGSYTCELFKNSNFQNRLSYYDGSDVLNITDIDL